jgi:hypothetical protein
MNFAIVTLEPALLLNLEDQVNKKLPPKGKPVPRWKRSFLENCQIFNIDTWNENFPKWPVTRLSKATKQNLAEPASAQKD